MSRVAVYGEVSPSGVVKFTHACCPVAHAFVDVDVDVVKSVEPLLPESTWRSAVTSDPVFGVAASGVLGEVMSSVNV